MGYMKTWWIFGFEQWGGLRPVEMITVEGVRYVSLFFGLWLRLQDREEQEVSMCGSSFDLLKKVLLFIGIVAGVVGTVAVVVIVLVILKVLGGI